MTNTQMFFLILISVCFTSAIIVFVIAFLENRRFHRNMKFVEKLNGDKRVSSPIVLTDEDGV